MSQGMSALADRKDYAGVLGLVDYTLAFAREKQEQQSPGAAMRAPRVLDMPPRDTRAIVPVSYAIWVGTAVIASSRSRFLKSTNILMARFSRSCARPTSFTSAMISRAT